MSSSSIILRFFLFITFFSIIKILTNILWLESFWRYLLLAQINMIEYKMAHLINIYHSLNCSCKLCQKKKIAMWVGGCFFVCLSKHDTPIHLQVKIRTLREPDRVHNLQKLTQMFVIPDGFFRFFFLKKKKKSFVEYWLTSLSD